MAFQVHVLLAIARVCQRDYTVLKAFSELQRPDG
jgi:hypothetical protein